MNFPSVHKRNQHIKWVDEKGKLNFASGIYFQTQKSKKSDVLGSFHPHRGK